MKKVFMMMAFAAFFSMAATSCGEEKKEEGTEAEAEHGDEAHEEEAH